MIRMRWWCPAGAGQRATRRGHACGRLLATLALCAATAGTALAQQRALDIGAVMAGEAPGHLRAVQPRTFSFPADHGPHPGYRTEWWYLTGNLADRAGEHYGFQFTLFRFELLPPPGPDATAPPDPSAWRGRATYMAHLALTDVAGARFHAAERFARGALGLAGARRGPFSAWLEDWSLEAVQGDDLPWRLRAAGEDFGLQLTLQPGRPPVLQGEAGLSQKSAAPGNASYYYSMTRLPVHGHVDTARGRAAVQGLAWLDREWGTSALADDQAGWDWFALQLDDGRDLMFYQLRRRDGSRDPFSAGVLVDARGSTPLAADAVRIQVRGEWRSPAGGRRYPAGWRLQVEEQGIDLRIEPLLADQEHRGTFHYWEGAVRLRGADGTPAGYGYVEMTGY